MLKDINFLSIAITLFLIIDAIGVVPIVLSLFKNISPARQKKIIAREMGIALAIMLCAQYLGGITFSFLKISNTSLCFSSFAILFIMSLSLIFPKETQGVTSNSTEEPFIVPIAIPFIAGTGVISKIILLEQQQVPPLMLTNAIILAWGASSLILYCTPIIQKRINSFVITILEKIAGLLVMTLAIDSLLTGIRSLMAY